MTKPKDYVPVAQRERRCALPGCRKRVRVHPGVGRPPRFCSEACRRRAEVARVGAWKLAGSRERAEDGALQPTQADVMRARGYLTVADAATRVGRSKTTLYNWASRGDVTSIRIGRTWYVEAASIAAFLGPAAAKLLGIAGPR